MRLVWAPQQGYDRLVGKSPVEELVEMGNLSRGTDLSDRPI
jgi:hypothetical protein